MNLCIDIGNTTIKAGIFERDNLVQSFVGLGKGELLDLFAKYKIQYTILSSVRDGIESLKQKIETQNPLFILHHKLALPIKNHYKTPQTLGVDRIAGVVAAKTLYPNSPCLVVDAGTCITYDFVDENAHYWGGNISPGLQMRFDAMHHFTDKLPHLENYKDLDLPFIGQSTEEAMVNGVVQGIRLEIEGIIEHLRAENPKLIIITTGGDAFFFDKKIKQQIFASPNLLLVGLNQILRYNVEKNS